MFSWNFFLIFIFVVVVSSNMASMQPDPIFCKKIGAVVDDGFNYKNQSCFHPAAVGVNLYLDTPSHSPAGCKNLTGFTLLNFGTEDEFEFVQKLLNDQFPNRPTTVGIISRTNTSNWDDDNTTMYLPPSISSDNLKVRDCLRWYGNGKFEWVKDDSSNRREWNECNRDLQIGKVIKNANCQSGESIVTASKCYWMPSEGCLRNITNNVIVRELVNDNCHGQPCTGRVVRCPRWDPSFKEACADHLPKRPKRPYPVCKQHRLDTYGDAMYHLKRVYYMYLVLYISGVITGLIGFACYWIEPMIWKEEEHDGNDSDTE